jgi:hypothetical protein
VVAATIEGVRVGMTVGGMLGGGALGVGVTTWQASNTRISRNGLGEQRKTRKEGENAGREEKNTEAQRARRKAWGKTLGARW